MTLGTSSLAIGMARDRTRAELFFIFYLSNLSCKLVYQRVSHRFGTVATCDASVHDNELRGGGTERENTGLPLELLLPVLYSDGLQITSGGSLELALQSCQKTTKEFLTTMSQCGGKITARETSLTRDIISYKGYYTFGQ